MIKVLRTWYERHFADPQVVILSLILFFGGLIIVVMSDHLKPVLVSIVIAYLLDGMVTKLIRYKIPYILAVSIVTALSITFFLMSMLVLLPLLSQQLGQLFNELPIMLARGQQILSQLPQQYPDYVSESQVSELISSVSEKVTTFGQTVLKASLSSVVGLITFFVYLILVPLLVFFFLKDKGIILHWAGTFLPTERKLVSQVWHELHIKIASYIRGKFIEILIVWLFTLAVFLYMDLNYAILLSVLVGLSVIIPYVGATVVTIPVALIAYFQWGISTEFWYLMIGYGVVQFLDGNIVVPLLFSEVVNLHPVAIIVAVVFFGSIWGVWGVFFAIPLATLVQAVLHVWPKQDDVSQMTENLEITEL